MINVKEQIYNALISVDEIKNSVTNHYPHTWEQMPCVQYMEEQNTVFEVTDDEEQLSNLTYRIDVWGTSNISNLVVEIDNAISSLGLKRVFCSDVDDPTHYLHTQMRYAGVIDNTTEIVYWNDNR